MSNIEKVSNIEKEYRRKTLLREHKGRIKMHDKDKQEDNDIESNDTESKNNMISRLINWKFGQAFMYKDALKHKDSLECLKLLEELWGDTGWDRNDTIFGNIVQNLVDLIRLKEGWTYKEFYEEEEEIDAI